MNESAVGSRPDEGLALGEEPEVLICEICITGGGRLGGLTGLTGGILCAIVSLAGGGTRAFQDWILFVAFGAGTGMVLGAIAGTVLGVVAGTIAAGTELLAEHRMTPMLRRTLDHVTELAPALAPHGRGDEGSPS